MNEQTIDRDRLRSDAESALECGTFDADVMRAVPVLLEQLEQAEARIKAVEDVLEEPDAMVGFRTHVAVGRVRRALEG